MSELQSTAPVLCMPAQPARVSMTGLATPAWRRPSVKVWSSSNPARQGAVQPTVSMNHEIQTVQG